MRGSTLYPQCLSVPFYDRFWCCLTFIPYQCILKWWFLVLCGNANNMCSMHCKLNCCLLYVILIRGSPSPCRHHTKRVAINETLFPIFLQRGSFVEWSPYASSLPYRINCIFLVLVRFSADQHYVSNHTNMPHLKLPECF